MTELPKGISVSCFNNEVHVRVVGRGTFQNGQPLRRYAAGMMERGCRQFTVDLRACEGMDSTFLGVLAGIGLRLGQAGRGGVIHAANVGARNLELLQTLGLDRLLGLAGKQSPAYEPPPQAEFHRLPDSDITALTTPLSKSDTADLMLEAHDDLIRADQRNLAKFKDLTTFLREKVEQHDADTRTKE